MAEARTVSLYAAAHGEIDPAAAGAELWCEPLAYRRHFQRCLAIGQAVFKRLIR